nr:MAG TPA: envelope glycoprotein [Bacteriophage sp.]
MLYSYRTCFRLSVSASLLFSRGEALILFLFLAYLMWCARFQCAYIYYIASARCLQSRII